MFISVMCLQEMEQAIYTYGAMPNQTTDKYLSLGELQRQAKLLRKHQERQSFFSSITNKLMCSNVAQHSSAMNIVSFKAQLCQIIDMPVHIIFQKRKTCYCRHLPLKLASFVLREHLLQRFSHKSSSHKIFL